MTTPPTAAWLVGLEEPLVPSEHLPILEDASGAFATGADPGDQRTGTGARGGQGRQGTGTGLPDQGDQGTGTGLVADHSPDQGGHGTGSGRPPGPGRGRGTGSGRAVPLGRASMLYDGDPEGAGPALEALVTKALELLPPPHLGIASWYHDPAGPDRVACRMTRIEWDRKGWDLVEVPGARPVEAVEAIEVGRTSPGACPGRTGRIVALRAVDPVEGGRLLVPGRRLRTPGGTALVAGMEVRAPDLARGSFARTLERLAATGSFVPSRALLEALAEAGGTLLYTRRDDRGRTGVILITTRSGLGDGLIEPARRRGTWTGPEAWRAWVQ